MLSVIFQALNNTRESERPDMPEVPSFVTRAQQLFEAIRQLQATSTASPPGVVVEHLPAEKPTGVSRPLHENEFPPGREPPNFIPPNRLNEKPQQIHTYYPGVENPRPATLTQEVRPPLTSVQSETTEASYLPDYGLWQNTTKSDASCEITDNVTLFG